MAEKELGHVSQSPKCILGGDARGYCQDSEAMTIDKGKVLGTRSHLKYPMVTMADGKDLFSDSQKTYKHLQ